MESLQNFDIKVHNKKGIYMTIQMTKTSIMRWHEMLETRD